MILQKWNQRESKTAKLAEKDLPTCTSASVRACMRSSLQMLLSFSFTLCGKCDLISYGTAEPKTSLCLSFLIYNKVFIFFFFHTKKQIRTQLGWHPQKQHFCMKVEDEFEQIQSLASCCIDSRGQILYAVIHPSTFHHGCSCCQHRDTSQALCLHEAGVSTEYVRRTFEYAAWVDSSKRPKMIF